MKSILLISLMFLVSCATPKKQYYNTFWLGCMNGVLRYKQIDSKNYIYRLRHHDPLVEGELKSYDRWCQIAEAHVKDLMGD